MLAETSTYYGYVGNNPLSFIDPFGFRGCPPRSSGGWDAVQGALDLAGLAPGVGIIADLANAGISYTRGNYADAALSMSAAIPLAGTVAGLAKIAKVAKGEDIVDLFRFVSKGELNDLAATGGKFRPGPNSLDGKQFGRNLDEVQELGNRIGGADAIVRVRVPRSSTANALDQTPVDSFILRSGAVTAQPGSQLNLLNRTVIQVDRVR